MTPSSPPSGRRSGFSLLEVAIVLTIVGLIVGGSLMGYELITSAGMRKITSQFREYETAVGTFSEKYQSYPGDMPEDSAEQFGFAPTTRNASATTLHDNGYIESGSGADVRHSGLVSFTSMQDYELGTVLGNESLLFWQDLVSAGLTDGIFRKVTSDTQTITVPTTPAAMAEFLPTSRIGTGTLWSLVGNAIVTKNFYVLHSVGDTINEPAFTAREAERLDSKIDDGYAMSGIVRSAGPVSNGTLITYVVDGTAPDCNETQLTLAKYNVVEHENDVVCNLTIEANWQ